ncbi:MAG: 4Fe-4S dicluster domain-containing protein [Aureispira sp.]|nr:4Fe-4S dicluster domain-containing protein [Aureispira sp.]
MTSENGKTIIKKDGWEAVVKEGQVTVSGDKITAINWDQINYDQESALLRKVLWSVFDDEIKSKLSNTNAQVRIVSHTVVSPTLEEAIKDFKSKYPNTQHIQYDTFSSSALLDANQAMFRKRVVPNYHFDKAKCVVGIEADFLGTWISPVEYTAGYSANRRLTDKGIKDADSKMSRHIHFESRMSLTGSNADHRVLIKPSEQGAAVGALYTAVASAMGKSASSFSAPTFAWNRAQKSIESTAKSLAERAKKGEGALVVCGVNDVNVQMVVNAINEMLGAYGNTITWDGFSKQRRGNDKAISALAANMASADVLIVMDSNPAFDLPGMAKQFADGIKAINDKGGVTISMASALDETASLCQYVAPESHYLESWGDAEPKKGQYYLIQPTINPLFSTREAGENFLAWGGALPQAEQAYYEYLVMNWKSTVFGSQPRQVPFQTFWDDALHNGWFKDSGATSEVVETEEVEQPVSDTTSVDVEPIAPPVTSSDVGTALSKLPAPLPASEGSWEVSLYETVNMGSGEYANNPWLQEMPDPVMRTTWDNFVSIPIKWDGDNNYDVFQGLNDGDYIEVEVNGVNKKLPVIRQFGQMQGTVAIGLGYGRTSAGLAGDNVGQDYFPAVSEFKYSGSAKLSDQKGRDGLFACVQMHHTYGLNTREESGKLKVDESTGKVFNVDEQVLGHRGFQGSLTGRSVFFRATAKDLEKDIEELKEKREGYQYLNSKGLYPDFEEYKMGHHWAMSVDLTACTGCGACAVACMAENNVPVVGKFEVNKVHEMTWLRIDRYFYGDETSPNAVYMPMMCQHCDNAPCENVCPVAATPHSSEGLNQMAYNRCVGTRYCANNCPFKVRRFNWLDYTSADLFPVNEVDINRGVGEGHDYYTYMTDNLTRMVLNPDVTVRSRGVIEKCSFCVQRIQEGKLSAKVEGRRLEDSDIKVACQQACPAGAIVFGDRNNQSSGVAKLMKSDLAYIPLEETNTRSSVNYLMKVNNTDEEFSA